MFKTKAGLALISLAVLAGCSREGELTAQGITVVRSACPAVAVPVGTGDITLFNPETSRNADAIDVVAQITNVRSTCNEAGEFITSEITFDVQAQRRNGAGAREVVLPYFVVGVRAGDNVLAKSLSRVSLRFEDGQLRTSTTARASGEVRRSAATLPDAIREQITRRRRPGDADAAVDPMADPAVRAAVDRANFELLVGFQLTEDQLRYNVTR